nr:hypothetical protein [Sphingomonas solaris]
MLQKDCSEQPGHGELDLVDVALGNGVELHPVVGKLLAQPGHIFRISSQAIQRLADDDVHPPAGDIVEQALQTGAVAAVAGHLGVKVSGDHGTAEIDYERHARRRLIGAGTAVLQRAAMPTVEYDTRARHHRHCNSPVSSVRTLVLHRVATFSSPRRSAT